MNIFELLSLRNELAEPSSRDGGLGTHCCADGNHRAQCALHVLRNSLLIGQSQTGPNLSTGHSSLLLATIPAHPHGVDSDQETLY